MSGSQPLQYDAQCIQRQIGVQFFYATGNFIAAFRLVRLHQERFLKCYLLSFCLYLENPWTPLKEIWCWLIVYKKVFNFSFS